MIGNWLSKIILAAFSLIFATAVLQAVPYELVIKGGQVIDPETHLNAVRTLGINGGRIEKISEGDLEGALVIDATGLVVAPGFVDIHAHGQNTVSQVYQVRDGVTTALELERGTGHHDAALNKREGGAYINYGYSAGYGEIRLALKGGDFNRAFYETATPEEVQTIIKQMERELDAGAIGLGIPLDYFSDVVSEKELETLFMLAARREMPLFVHIRMYETVKDLTGFQELIDLTRKTGASLHMVHITSTALARTEKYLDMLDAAQAEGLDITTEIYPYTAASTGINTAVFDDGWQGRLGMTYNDIEWPLTGERFTGKAMWDEYRATYPHGTIITHAMREEWVQAAMTHQGVMIASDGMIVESLDERAHPRGRGTFARVLGRYVRELGVLSLEDALSRMTLLPARRLESFVPALKRKGRIQEGADADITIFNAETVIDRATFREPNQFSEGIEYVLVGGKLVVEGGILDQASFAGRPITTKIP
jgi:dihydroorotase